MTTNGERNPQALLNADVVVVIRAAFAGGASVVEVARAFGVDRKTVRDIRDRRRWGHVA